MDSEAINAPEAQKPKGAEPIRASALGPTSSPRSRIRYLRIRRWARRTSLMMKRLIGLAAYTAAASILVLFVWELFRHRIEIQPIAMPKPLAEAGYSPEVAARRLQDAMHRLENDAANAGAQRLTISMPSESPDIVVPTVGISLSTFAAYLRQFLGYNPRTVITGEVTQLPDRISLLLRLDGQVIFRSREVANTDRLENIWQQAAQAVMWEISPYRVALVLSNTDPERALRLADSIVQRYPAGDENFVWGRLMRGARLLDAYQYKAAEKEFRDVVKDASTGAALSWVPLTAPVSYAQPAQFYIGRMMFDRGKYELAIGELQKAIDLDPNDAGAHHFLALALQKLNQKERADEHFRKAREILYRAVENGRGTARVSIHIGLGATLLEQKNTKGALAQLRWAVELDPSSDDAHRSLCDGLHYAVERYDDDGANRSTLPQTGSDSLAVPDLPKLMGEALTACRRAVEIAPQRLDNQIALGMVLIKQKNFKDGLRAAIAALHLAPESPRVYELLGRLHAESGNSDSGDLDLATLEYLAAIERAPESRIFHNDFGIILFRQGKFGEAADAFRAALEETPRNPVIHGNLADAFLKQKNITDAIREYQEAIRLDQNNAIYNNRLGNLYFEDNKFKEAANAYRAALKASPDDTVIHRNLAEALFEQKDATGAIREYQEAIRLDQNNPIYNNRLGNLYFGDNKFNEAADAYRAALKATPDDAVIHGNLAEALFEQDDATGAIQEYKEAIRLDQNNAAYPIGLGNVFRQLGRFGEAIVQFKKAIALSPKDPVAWNYYGITLWSRDPLDREARAAYERAIELDPKRFEPYHNLAFTLRESANAESTAGRGELLAQACQILAIGLQQIPEEPHLLEQRDAIAKLPESNGCTPRPVPAGP